MNGKRRSALFVLVLFLLVLPYTKVFAGTTATCPPGTQPATSADLPLMTDAGIPTPTVGECWSPSSTAVGQTDASAKADLIKNYNQTQSSEPNNTGITNLNSTFAINLDNLLNAASKAGYKIMIISGWRDPNNNPPGGAGATSLHHKGLAADFQYPDAPGGQSSPTGSFHTCEQSSGGSASYKWIVAHDQTYGINTLMQAFSKPPSAYSGECNHLQATTGGNTSPPILSNGPPNPTAAITQAVDQGLQDLSGGSDSQSGNAGGDYGGGGGSGAANTPSGIPAPGTVLTSNYYCVTSTNPIIVVPLSAGTVFPSGCYNSSVATPNASAQCSLGLVNLGGSCVPMQMMQSLLSPTQPSSIPPIPAPAPAAPAAAPSSSAPAPSASATPTTSSSNGSLLQAPASVSVQPASVSTAAGGNIITTLNQPTTSASAILAQLANPQPIATPVASSTPVNLNPATQVVTQIVPPTPPQPNGNEQEPTAQVTSPVVLSGTAPSPSPISRVQTEAPPSTFTSGNLSGGNTQSAPPYNPQESTFTSNALAVLNTLQTELIGALHYLQPFQGIVPTQGD